MPAASTVPGPGEPEEAPLTASFEDLPERHDGSGFRFRVAFSEPLSWMNGRRLREDVVAVAGGRATAASRVNRRRDLWQLTVEPDSPADVTVTLAAGAACDSPGGGLHEGRPGAVEHHLGDGGRPGGRGAGGERVGRERDRGGRH